MRGMRQIRHPRPAVLRWLLAAGTVRPRGNAGTGTAANRGVVRVEGGVMALPKPYYQDGYVPISQGPWPPVGVDWYYSDSAVCIACGDCREIVPTLGRFDLLLTDPPYGIKYVVKEAVVGKGHRRVKRGGGLPIHGDDKPFDPEPWLAFPRVIMWGGNYYHTRLPDGGAWLVWDKTGGGRGPNNNFADLEIAWSNIGKQPQIFHHLWKGLTRDSEAGQKVLHPTQKPLELMRWCIGLAGDVQTILDPFAGSGTTGRAAKDLGRKAVLIEREERYCEIAARRCQQEVLPLTYPERPE